METAGRLRGLWLEQFEPIFRDTHIDNSILPRLTAEDLKDLCITSVGHRRRSISPRNYWRRGRVSAAWSPSEDAEPRRYRRYRRGPRCLRGAYLLSELLIILVDAARDRPA